jgi:hypothetical protein
MATISIPEGMIWQYQQTLRAGRLQHTWLLKGEHGGIHVDGWVSKALDPYPAEWMGGIECHTPCEKDKANHEHCWVLDGPCQHDGSSLRFSEQIAPYLPYPDKDGIGCMDDHAHELVLSTMLNRYRTWLKEPAEEAAQEQVS